MDNQNYASMFKYFDIDNSRLHKTVPFVMTLQCGDSGDIFPKYMFKDTFMKVSPTTWWNIACQSVTACDTDVQAKLGQQMLSVCYQLFSATATTARLERIFSSYGLVHSKLRNKLGNKKAAKLNFYLSTLICQKMCRTR